MVGQHAIHRRWPPRHQREFDVHLAIFVVVIGGVALCNWVISPRVWWMVIPAIGWGMIVGVHAYRAFRGAR